MTTGHNVPGQRSSRQPWRESRSGQAVWMGSFFVMSVHENERNGLAHKGSKGYTEPRRRASAKDLDERLRREPVFKKTEEAEWTRFSKALPSRQREDTEETIETDALSPPPSAPAAPSARAVSDINVGIGRSAAKSSNATAPSDVESFIGERTAVDGKFKSEASIRIQGTVKGEIESGNDILVEESATVTAKMTAATITVAGQLNGQIYCSWRLEIRPSGRVTGEVNAETLVMQEGAFFEGQLHMGKAATSEQEAQEPAAASR